MHTDTSHYLPKIWSGRDVLLIFGICIVAIALAVGGAHLIKPNIGYVRLLVDVVFVSATGVLVWKVAGKNGLSPEDVGFTIPRFRWIAASFGLGLAVVFVANELSLVFAKILGLSDPGGMIIMKESLSGTLWLDLVNLKLFTGLLVPITEEMLFRGVLFRYIRQERTFLFSALASALVFSAVHLSPELMLFAFLVGFVATWLYEKTRSLLSACIVHITANTLAVSFLAYSILLS